MSEGDATFALWKAVIGRTPKLELTKPEYDRILEAKSEIVRAISIEEEWDSLIQNYVDLEESILSAALDSMVRRTTESRTFHLQRQTFGRLFSNLLASCRGYLDHTPHHLGRIENGGAVGVFKSATNEAYDGNFAYRFLEALRNYTQHRGIPVHGTSFDTSWIGDRSKIPEDKDAKLRHWAGATINFSKILNDKRFKASVAAEIPADKLAIDVIEMTRVYVEALANVHAKVRNAISERISENLVTLRETIERYANANDGNVLGLAAAKFEGEQVQDSTDIFEDMLAWYEFLKARNGTLKNLKKRYVSSEILPKRAFH